MKRRISLLLAVVMVLGSFATVFAETPAVSVEQKSAEFLEKNNILKGNLAGDLELDKNMRRQDSVIMLSRLLGVEEEAQKTEENDAFKKFEDIKDKYYNGFISWALEKEFFVGHTEVRFGYNENITARDYAVVLLRALGYGEEVKGEDGWKAAFAKAKELGLLENVEAKELDEILRGQMAVLTFNALGTKVKGTEKTLAETLAIEMPAPEVLEVTVAANNLREIEVKYNKDVDPILVAEANKYSTTAGNIVSAEMSGNDTVILTVDGSQVVNGTNVMKNNTKYKLTIASVDEKVNKEYEFNTVDNSLPAVVEVVGLGTKGVKVVLSEPVQRVTARDFKVNGNNFYGSVTQTGREIFLKPYSGTFNEGENTLTIGSLTDFATFKSVSGTYNFNVLEDKEAPAVENITATEKTITIEFNKEVDKDSINTNTLYHSGKTDNKAEKVNALSGKKFEFVFKNRLPLGDLKVTVRDAVNYSGVKMASQDLVVKVGLDEVRPEVVTSKQKDGVVTLVFNKEMPNDDNNNKKTNYTVYNSKNEKVSNVKSVDVKGKEIDVTLFAQSNQNEEYTLKVEGLKDASVLSNTMLPYEVKLEKSQTAGLVKATASIEETDKDDNTKVKKVRVIFDKDMKIDTIVNPVNYQLVINGQARTLEAIGGSIDVVDSNGKLVIITLDKADVYSDIIFGEAIRDINDKKVAEFGTYVPLKAAEPVELEKAEQTKEDTIVLTFKEAIKDARASNFKIGEVSPSSVAIDGKKVTLTIAKAVYTDEVVTIEGKIENVLGSETVLPQAKVKVVDKISPVMTSMTANYNKRSKDLKIEIVFDKAMKSTVVDAVVGSMDLKIAGKETSLVDSTRVLSNDGKTLTITLANVDEPVANAYVTINVSKPENILGANEAKLGGDLVKEIVITIAE